MFIETFNKHICPFLIENPCNAYLGINHNGVEAPTLHEANIAYENKNVGYAWMLAQLTILFNASISKDADKYESIQEFAEVFASQVRHYKVTELLLFFGRYKAGMYQDDSWSTFNPQSIGKAFFGKFLKDRSQELASIMSKQESYKREKDRERYKIAYLETKHDKIDNI